VARLLRYALPTLALAWLFALAAAGAGSGAGQAVLPAVVLPAMLLAAAALACLSLVAPSGGVWARPSQVSMARRVRAVTVLRSADPDAAGRPRPRAPGA
jgi:hypothetical protein